MFCVFENSTDQNKHKAKKKSQAYFLLAVIIIENSTFKGNFNLNTSISSFTGLLHEPFP